MLLTETNIIHYLLGSGLSDAKTFVQGRYSCRSSEGRHRHFIINKEFEGRKLFIKQAPKGSTEKTGFLFKEGLFYQAAFSNKTFAKLKPYLPGVLLFDAKDAVLALEYYDSHTGLDVWLHSGENENTINEITAELAAALFALHSISIDNFKIAQDIELFAAAKP